MGFLALDLTAVAESRLQFSTDETLIPESKRDRKVRVIHNFEFRKNPGAQKILEKIFKNN